MEIRKFCFSSPFIFGVYLVLFVFLNSDCVGASQKISLKEQFFDTKSSIKNAKNIASEKVWSDKLRKKRMAAEMLDELNAKLKNCRATKNDKSCDELYKRILEVASDLTGKLVQMKSMMMDFRHENQLTESSAMETHKKESNSNVTKLMNSFKGVAPSIHEDMTGNEDKFWNYEKLKLVEELIEDKHRIREQKGPTQKQMKPNGRDTEDKTVTPLKNENFGMERSVESAVI